MFKNFNTIRRLRKLSEKDVNSKFLASLRIGLAGYMKANPASKEIGVPFFSRLQFFNTRYVAVALIVIIAVMSGGGVTLASFGTLPGDALYPVKSFSEDMKSLLAFSPEAKQKLEEKLAARRIAEVEALMARPEINQANVDIALSRLDKHMNDVAKAIEARKNSGKDMNEIAQKVSENFTRQQDILEKIFRVRKSEIREKAGDIRIDLREAQESGDATTTEALIRELNRINDFKKTIEDARISTDKKISENESLIERGLEIKSASEKAIADAKNAKEIFLNEASEQGWSVTDGDLSKYGDFLAKAEEALAQEHYVQARQLARQAKEALRLLAREKEKDDSEGMPDERKPIDRIREMINREGSGEILRRSPSSTGDREGEGIGQMPPLRLPEYLKR